jgi:hypothetical protein
MVIETATSARTNVPGQEQPCRQFVRDLITYILDDSSILERGELFCDEFDNPVEAMDIEVFEAALNASWFELEQMVQKFLAEQTPKPRTRRKKVSS